MAKDPFYKIFFEKSKVEITDMVSQLRFEDCVDEDNLLVLTIDNTTNEFIDEVSGYTGDNVIFQYGLLEGEKTGNRLAEIKSIEPKYSSSIKLTIKCHDFGFAIKKHTSNKIYDKLTSSKIVKSIANQFGFEAEIEDTSETFTMPQANKTYFEFCKKLAKKEGFDFFIIDNTIKFKKRDLSVKSKKIYEYGLGSGNVLSFEPKYEDKGSSNQVSSSGIDPDSSELFSIVSKPEGTSESGFGSKLLKWDKNGNLLSQLTESGSSMAMPDGKANLVKKKTDKEVSDSILSNMTATLKLELDLSVNVEDVITMAGVAKVNSGNWYINKKIDIVNMSGGLTDLELSKNASNNKSVGDGSPAKINNTIGDKNANASKTLKVRKYDVDGNQTN